MWKVNFCHLLSGTKVHLEWSWVHFEATSAFLRCRCFLWWPSLSPLPEGISSETSVAKEVRDRLSSASLHICTACDSALSAPSLAFFTSGSFTSASVLPWVTSTTFIFTSLLPWFLQLRFWGKLLFKGVPSVSASPWLPCTAQRTFLHSPHAGYFLLILFLLLLHFLLSFVQDFSDCSCFALRVYSSKCEQGPCFRSPWNIHLRFTLLFFAAF